MDYLNLGFSMETFEDRLILQKGTYLAQAAGLRLGYHFRWDLRGPYCPALANDGYAIAEEIQGGQDEAEQWQFDSVSRKLLDPVHGLIPASGRRDRIVEDLELFASVHFLVNRGQASADDPKQVVETLRRCQKDYTEERVRQTIAELKRNGLLV
jgi:uncharacterized protein YwgA